MRSADGFENNYKIGGLLIQFARKMTICVISEVNVKKWGRGNSIPYCK